MAKGASDGGAAERPRRVSKRPSGPRLVARVMTASAVLSVALFVGLSLQMALGHDPALGPKATAAKSQVQRPRRIVKTTVVVKRIQQPSAGGYAGGSSSYASTGGSTSYGAPAAAPAPAPAAPAPVATSTS